MTRLDVIVPTAQQVLQRHDRVVHLQHLLAAGLAREDVGHLRHRGTIRRARIGWYVDPGLPVEAVRAITVGGSWAAPRRRPAGAWWCPSDRMSCSR